MTPPRVVLDTVIFVQALISNRGPAAACIERAKAGQFILLLSQPLMMKCGTCRSAPSSPADPHLTPDRVQAFVEEVVRLALVLPTSPQAFALPRDPKDEPLIDAAVAGGAGHLVTWNARHLTYLMRQDTPEGIEFCRRFPTIRILTPPEFLHELDALAAAPKT